MTGAHEHHQAIGIDYHPVEVAPRSVQSMLRDKYAHRPDWLNTKHREVRRRKRIAVKLKGGEG